ncbi:hypothetical protein [Xylophilus sp.]|uniref:hypothetical protein n=1 Tax=Xylophilus sp. TaxID=2653893 RepID=UPI002D7E421F|nr:hypothetical protein [Xylophilus sp.]
MIPRTYDQWRHCITVECGIALTPEYAAGRLAVWNDPECDETQRFRKLYGDAHWNRVRAWFQQAADKRGAPIA